MNSLLLFPKQAFYGRVVPKNKIYEHISPTAALKRLFVDEVDKITWLYKLSPETINLPVKEEIQEVQIFSIELKNETLKNDVLAAIDKATPSPIIFILSYKNMICYKACYKRRNEADKSKWVLSNYFSTEWLPADGEKVPLPVALDMKNMYHSLLKEIMPLAIRNNEAFDDMVCRYDRLKQYQREADKLNSRLQKEKQFNRRVEINTELKKINKEIETLRG